MESETSIVKVAMSLPPAVRQAESDEHLIELWLHGRSPHTARAYRADLERFRGFVGKPLHAVTLGDIQAFVDSIAAAGISSASQGRALASIKSLFSFAHGLGYLPFNVARAVPLPRLKNKLAERILSESHVQRLLARETSPRNAVMLKLLYIAGLRVSEACALSWRDCQEREGGGQITVFGKGSKTRVIVLPAGMWSELVALRGDAGADDPVFRSKRGGHLDQSQINRIVHAAAERAGIKELVSPHWLRHAHASHAIDRGAPIHLVQSTLGHASVATTGRYLHARPNDSSARFLPG